MGSYRRSPISQRVLDELWNQLHPHDHDRGVSRPTRQLDALAYHGAQVLITIWLILLLSAPLLLVFTLFGLANYTAGWLAAAGITLVGSIFAVSIFGIARSVVDRYVEHQPLDGERLSLSLMVAISIAFALWAFFDTRTYPLSGFDTIMYRIMGMWFAVLFVGFAIREARDNPYISGYLRIGKIIAASALGVAVFVRIYFYTIDTAQSPVLRSWENSITFVLISALIANHSISVLSRPTAIKWRQLGLAVVVSVVCIVVFLGLYRYINAR